MEPSPEQKPPDQRPKIRLKPTGNIATPSPSASPTTTTTQTTDESHGKPPGAVDPPVYWDALHLPMPAAFRPMLLVLAVLLVGISVCISLPTFPATFLLAIILGSTVWRISTLALKWNLPAPAAHAAGLASLLALSAILMFVIVPWWQRDAAAFNNGIVTLTHRLLPEPESASPEQSSKHHRQWANLATSEVTGFNDRLASYVAGHKLLLWTQIALMLVAIGTLPVITGHRMPAAPKSATATIALMARFHRHGGQLALIATCRVTKALTLSALTVAGASLGRLDGAWFIGGWVLVFALVTHPGPWIGCLLAALMIPQAPQPLCATAAVIVTGAAMIVADNRLQWYVYRRPALMAGLINPLTTLTRRTTGDSPGVVWWIFKVARISVTVALLGILAWIGIEIVPEFLKDRSRREAIDLAEDTLRGGNTEAALKEFRALFEKYPHDPGVLMGMVMTQSRRKDYADALLFAEKYANWQEPPKMQTSLTGSLKSRVLAYISVAPTVSNRANAYEHILDSIEQVDDYRDVVKSAADQALAINPDSLPALLSLGALEIATQNPDRALQLAERGMKIAPGQKGWHALRASAYLQKKDWAKVIEEAEAELAIDPLNENMRVMAHTAAAAKSRGLK